MDIAAGVLIVMVMVIGILWEILMELRTIRFIINNKNN
jgi:hypothetical protein